MKNIKLQVINYAVYVTIIFEGDQGNKTDWSYFRSTTKEDAERKAKRFFSVAYGVNESQILINKNR